MRIEPTWERSLPTRDPLGPLVPSIDPYLACIEIDRDALVLALGPPHYGDEVLDGIGPMQVWRFEWRCGCRIAVCSVEELDGPARVATILSNDADVDHVLHHLTVPGRVSWRADREHDGARAVRPEHWMLVRQDDNGIEVEMRSFDSAIAAECARRTYEDRGHKQLYTTRPLPPDRRRAHVRASTR